MAGTTIINCHHSVNGILFGCSSTQIQAELDAPDKVAQNYSGELEMLFGTSIYRCLDDRFVECTVPDEGKFIVNGVDVLSLFDWLAGCADVVDKAKFRISLQHGLAYDYRNPDNGSVTIFEAGRWDGLVLPQ